LLAASVYLPSPEERGERREERGERREERGERREERGRLECR
jgi:hypothetical protein